MKKILVSSLGFEKRADVNLTSSANENDGARKAAKDSFKVTDGLKKAVEAKINYLRTENDGIRTGLEHQCENGLEKGIDVNINYLRSESDRKIIKEGEGCTDCLADEFELVSTRSSDNDQVQRGISGDIAGTNIMNTETLYILQNVAEEDRIYECDDETLCQKDVRLHNENCNVKYNIRKSESVIREI
ncbi:unnamed protein product [Acanthoscelides obtectus]|uniref:Uncharacterized protein n=1 Tax=Acanthoscelides obtectus TaxID=200917 RepID=A0A9P0JUN8_ACAOB|nr:unnamed protein product [Acanthoscelides obtectus]CAK1667263.1 hypothetical protein AOBTE_LOCUS25746 [Acanthoscelides obtectus]